MVTQHITDMQGNIFCAQQSCCNEIWIFRGNGMDAHYPKRHQSAKVVVQ